MSNRPYGLDYVIGWDMAHDPQMRPAPTERGMCPMCGELFPMEELDRNGGLCPPCYYASLEPDPDDTELFEGEQKGGGDNAGKR